MDRQKFDLHTLAMEKKKRDIQDLSTILILTEVKESESALIRKDLQRICHKFGINNPFVRDDL